MEGIYPIERCPVPIEYNAMIRRIKAKYPYLDGWYHHCLTGPIVCGREIEQPERYLDSLSLSEKENPFGSYRMKIIDCNKELVNFRRYKYAGELRIKHHDKIDARNCSIWYIEDHIEKMMKIIEEKRLELKKVAINIRKREMETDFENDK